MTKMPSVLRGLALAIALAAGVVGPIAAHARIDVIAVESQLTDSNGLATATFKIQISNHEETAMTSVRAVFAGDIEVSMNDVAGDATVTSGGQKLVFASADLPATKNVPVNVTVKYFTDGVEQSMPALLTIRRAE
jgi:hypothetical protein